MDEERRSKIDSGVDPKGFGVNTPNEGIELPPLVAKADRAMKEAVAAAIAEHWRAGRPVYVWQDEQIVALYPDGTSIPTPRESLRLTDLKSK